MASSHISRSSSASFQRVAAAVLAAGASFTLMTVPIALAQDAGLDLSAMTVDEMISELETISRDAEAKQEELDGLIAQLEDKQAEIDKLNAELDQRRTKAESMKAVADEQRQEVNSVAVAKLKAANVDPISTVASSLNPQEAIDRSAYLNALNRSTEAKALRSRDITRQAADEFAAVASREAEAKFEAAELEKQKAEVEAQQEAMVERTDAIRARVDEFTPEEEAEWLAKDGPVAEYSIAGLLGSNETGMAALQAAMTKLGSPYSWGAAGPDAFDCSGLVYWAYQQAGITLPRTSMAMMQSGVPVSIDQIQPGDVVGYYAGASHVGMYAGNGLIVHSSDYGIPVQVVPLENAPIYGIRRYQ